MEDLKKKCHQGNHQQHLIIVLVKDEFSFANVSVFLVGWRLWGGGGGLEKQPEINVF